MVSMVGDRRSQILCAACGLGVFGIAIFYMAQWLQMPLYSDEVALRLWKARFLADGSVEYSILPQCPSNVRDIPTILRPVAYLFSAFDFAYGWSFIREIPLFGVLFALGAYLVLLFNRRAPAAMLATAACFVGVAGSGLVLFRFEIPLIFYGAACAIGYLLIRRDTVGPVAVCVYLMLSTLLALFGFFIHLQTLILAPLGMLLAAGFMIRHRSRAVRILAGLSVLLIATGALTAISAAPTVRCAEFPKIERSFDEMTLGGLAKHGGMSAIGEYLGSKLDLYTDQFLFKRQYGHNYLPGITSGGGSAYSRLNTAISVAVLLNLLIACGVLFYSGIGTARLVISNRHSLRESLILAATTPYIYLFLATAGHLALFIVDVPTNFYRASYINFSLVMINALALSGLKGRAQSVVWPIAVLGIVVSIFSATVSSVEMKSKFLAGWSGTGISLDTNWSAVRLDVAKLAGKCGIKTNDQGIIIDDVTFDALKQHPHLSPFTYIGLGYNPDDPGMKKPPEFIRSVGAKYLLARCAFFPFYKVVPDARSDELCCSGL